jgi:hypothetical protein
VIVDFDFYEFPLTKDQVKKFQRLQCFSDILREKVLLRCISDSLKQTFATLNVNTLELEYQIRDHAFLTKSGSSTSKRV